MEQNVAVSWVRPVTIGFVVAVLVIGGWYFVFSPSGSYVSSENALDAPGIALRSENPNALPTVIGGNREKIRMDIATPGVGATDLPENVAVPVSVIQAPNGSAAFRHFNITAEKSAFTPSIIVINEGDVLDISLTAVDRDYSFEFPDMGFAKKITKGTTGNVNFQISNFGQYKFVCAELCSPAVDGTLIVNER